jgi:plasmid stabilization system protein ParE
MRLRFTARARRHLNDIALYIAERNPDAAHAVGCRIREVTELLPHLPYLGREGTLPNTREMVVPGLPYVIVCQVEADTVDVLGIYHAAQRTP